MKKFKKDKNIQGKRPVECAKTEIKVKVLPRSSKNMIVGRLNDVFTVKLSSPPVEGKANKALVALLSEKLCVAKRNIEIISGEKSRHKSLRIYGLSQQEIKQLLER